VRQDPAFFRGDGQDGLRDGCRVPIPWSGTSAPYGFGPGEGAAGSWLPQPDSWGELSVAAQSGRADSTLELYRSAIALRRELPGLGDGTLEWLPGPAGALVFRRGGVVCVLNTLSEPLPLVVPGGPLLSSVPLGTVPAPGETVPVPAESCSWWAV
jgi:alpha-glucosidase